MSLRASILKKRLHSTLVVQSSFATRYSVLVLVKRYSSVSPFTEPTSPNPTATKYAQTTESLHTYGSYLTQCLPKFIQQFSVLKDELVLHVAPSAVVPVLTFLRDHSQCQFKSVVDITAVDFPEREKRFEVVYNLLSIKHCRKDPGKDVYAGFEGHPLRKDFPLTGYTEVRYDEERKRVVYEPLQLTQAFRISNRSLHGSKLELALNQLDLLT
ncbi:F420H2 dehydrogenase [Chiua virens]|nr:F420H2 dehydrogenase [Chiua virens]